MSKSKGYSVASKSEEEAAAIARGIQKPGQTKEQTKLIAQGIKKGIDLYKKQQGVKNRELDKRRKQSFKQQVDKGEQAESAERSVPAVIYRQHWLPWLLLVLSWVVFLYFYFSK